VDINTPWYPRLVSGIMNRKEAVSELADYIAAISIDHPVRVGIDGVDCAGKTSLAKELAEQLRSTGREVISASIDGFHNSQTLRYRQGRSSPRGYYEDSFNSDAVVSCILNPLGPSGNRLYRTALFNYRTDQPVDNPVRIAGDNAILVFDGVFLHRPELIHHFDFTVFIDTGFDVAIRRAIVREQYLYRNEDKIVELYQRKYIPGQKIYLSEQCPYEQANAIFKNDDIENPELIIKSSQ